jgi:hypothetical protein
MKHRTVAEEQRSGTHWIVVGVVLVSLAFFMWWLVANTALSETRRSYGPAGRNW